MLLGLCGHASAQGEPLKIGSKRFTESYVLGEVLLHAAGHAVHRPGLGNTGILHAALVSGAIDVYPEYTGTIVREILGREGNPSLAEIDAALAAQGLAASIPLGFNNTYAIGVARALATKLGLRTIGDLAAHPALRFGISHEFLGRKDGWPGLARAYGLQRFRPTGLDHGLAYEALASGRVDVIDVYTTDAKIARYDIRILADDRDYFPRYDAVLLHRRDAPQRHAAQWAALARLEGRIDEATMLRMNAAAEIEGRSFKDAARLLDAEARPQTAAARRLVDALFDEHFGRLTVQHLVLVFGSVAASMVAGIPLGIAAATCRRLEKTIFGIVGVLQTIPSLALLAFLVAAVGAIGIVPAAIALFLYGLLPIVRNTHAGLLDVGQGLRQAAAALGLSRRDSLRYVELPVAAPAILAGIKTSAVINVGTATIAAFVGAGGYGERIATGLALNDSTLLLAGAIPAAALALLIQSVLDRVERRIAPWRPLPGAARHP
jgi:osmoprotectant transport system permease protein